MGKPGKFITWATEANFPAGGNTWNGQACKVAPVGDIFIPGTVAQGGTKVPAEWLNYLFNAHAGGVQALQDWAGNAPAINWSPIQSHAFRTSSNWGAAAWDALGNRWIVALMNATITQAVTTTGVDAVWDPVNAVASPAWPTLGATITTTSIPSAALAADGLTSGTTYLVLSPTATNLATLYTSTANGNFTVTTTSATTATAPPAAHYFRGTSVSGLWWGCGSSSGSNAFLNAPSTGSLSGVGAVNWILRDNGQPSTGSPMMVMMPGGTTGTFTYWTTTTGNSTTTHSSTAWSNGTFASVFGLDYGADALGPCWILGIYDGFSNKMSIYRSTDASSWTLQYQFATANLQGTSLACLGTLVVITLADNGAGGPDSWLWSPDGGVTWYYDQANFPTNLSTGAGYVAPKVHQNGQQFLALNSLWLRYSHLAGTPSTPVA